MNEKRSKRQLSGLGLSNYETPDILCHQCHSGLVVITLVITYGHVIENRC